MSGFAMSWAAKTGGELLKAKKISHAERRVLIELANCHHYDTGLTFPTARTLAKLAGCRRTAVDAALRRFAELGLISITPRPGQSNSYELRLPQRRATGTDLPANVARLPARKPSSDTTGTPLPRSQGVAPTEPPTRLPGSQGVAPTERGGWLPGSHEPVNLTWEEPPPQGVAAPPVDYEDFSARLAALRAETGL